jgi:hypothetical protein
MTTLTRACPTETAEGDGLHSEQGAQKPGNLSLHSSGRGDGKAKGRRDLNPPPIHNALTPGGPQHFKMDARDGTMHKRT